MQRSNEFTPELQQAYKEAKKKAKTPWWMYFWLLLIVALILFVAIVGIASRPE